MNSVQFAPDHATRARQCYGHYVIEKPLGRGAGAMVFLGKHLYLDTPAALKIPHEPHSSLAGQRFNEEAYLIARLVHPSIVRILDYGIQSDRAYLAMDYAPGGTLNQLRGMTLPLDLVVDYARQIASGLDYLQARGIIHCDIKPSNLLIGRDKRILLSDFGIALSARSTLTGQEGIICGTPRYMAPEQIMGKPCFASDQYALALVLYELLCGLPPFWETHFDVVQQHLHAEPPALRERGIALPSAVDEVIARALAKDPQARYHSSGHFAQALKQAASVSASSFAVTSYKRVQPGAATSRAARTSPPPVERKAGRLLPLSALCSGTLLATALIWLLSLLHYSHAQIVATLFACWLISILCVAATTTYRKAALLVSCIALLGLLCVLIFHSALVLVATMLLLLLPCIAIAVSLRIHIAERKSRN